MFAKLLRNLGLNEADTLKSSSILIYSRSEHILYTKSDWDDAMLIKGENKYGDGQINY